jgi:glycerol-3-phosphate dehydrogenase
MASTDYDIAIVGGGINGAGIARDAAGRGLRVFLCEQGDLAGATSSASTKLIHGGLRYLEHYEFRLVREALTERETLWRMAPHCITPMRFVLPHHGATRPAWLVRLGLFLYDHLGGRRLLPPTRTLDLRHDAAGAPLKPGFTRAFEYSDCWVDDARFVVLNALDAAEHGAVVRTRTRCVTARRVNGAWRLTLEDRRAGGTSEVTARALINAAGPWMADFLGQVAGANTRARVRLVKGSHIVVPRLFAHDRAYILQNDDRRIVFAIPYERDFTLIGTTDVDYKGAPEAVAITEAETAYLCRAVNAYFGAPVRPEDVVHTYSGVRPLYDDGATAAQEATRDYVLDLDAPDGEPALLNVFGGKITTYRRLAEAALDKLARPLGGIAAPWTAGSTLPGGDFPAGDVPAQVSALTARHPYIEAAHALRLVHAYGTRAATLLGDAASADDLGPRFGGDLTGAEVGYLVDHEWAASADDVLWRRSKLGLRHDAAEKARLERWMSERAAP